MIISASRRTDIPAFYAEWFINRIRAGFCLVPNPFNSEQVARIALGPQDVDTIVFWTRHPLPMFAYLEELDRGGYPYYFQYTLMNNPRPIDPRAPGLKTALRTFRTLSDRIGPEKVIWRYDPIVFTSLTDADFHRRTYAQIAGVLKGYTRRSVISIMDEYPKIRKRLGQMEAQGARYLMDEIPEGQRSQLPWFKQLMQDLVDIAAANDMQIVSCAETYDLKPYGIQPGKCIDGALIQKISGVEIPAKKDPYQREACGCVASKDIGMYNTCLFGCRYCYATSNYDRAARNHKQHDPRSPSLIE